MLSIFTAFISDYLASKGFVLASGTPAVGQLVLGRIMQKRAEAAREILLDAMAKGQATAKNIPEEEAAAILFRYMRAAEEGAARLNLRLLAAVIVGQTAEPSAYANEFLRWADTLSTLRREEVLVLGILHREAEKLKYLIPADGNFWLGCLAVLSDEFKMSKTEAESAASATMRTGLVGLLGGLYNMGHAYMPGSKLRDLAEMADIEAIYMQTEYGQS